MGLKLMTLGAVSILFNEQPLDTQFGVKARALLLYTSLQSQPVSRERLAAMFWQDVPQERASGNLRMTLMSLRERLGESAHITRTDVELENWSDVRTFQDTLNTLVPLLSSGQSCGDSDLRQIEEALRLYQGPFLQNFSLTDAEQFELWSHTTREALRRQFFKASEDLICHYETVGRYAEALHWSEHILKIDPLHEAAYRSLMRLYARRGERVLAMREFETCKQFLAAELNVAPDPETLTLYDQIVAGAFTGASTPTEAPQIVIPKRLIPHNLPGRLTPLIGRTTELNEIRGLLQEARLITLVGTGGIGKTRLASELAAQMLAEQAYPDGIYFVDLSSIQRPSQVIEAVADALEITESSQVSLSTQLLRSLKNKRLLLILDNFEHVLDAADQIEDWLKACPQLTIVVTSREPLQLYAEYLYTLPSLPDADAWILFAKRVSAVKSGFVLTGDNEADIKAICIRLEGLPLAIELAASHAQALSLAQILQGLSNSLAFLKSQRRGGPERQRTMYETIEWSYQLLNASEQALYRLVSVFVGGWTLESVEAIGGKLTNDLPALVSKQLIQLISESPARYRMLEPIHEHARHKLEEHREVFLFQEAHLYYFTNLAETAVPGLRTNDQHFWFQRLVPEHDNFRAALIFADEHPQFAEQLCRLMSGLGYFYYVRASIREGNEWIDRALSKEVELPLNVQADLLASAGHLAHAANEYQRADDYHKAALALYLRLEDWTNSAFMMSTVGMRERDEERSLALAQEAYSFAQRAGDDFVLLNAANNYAVSMERLGDLEGARAIFEDIIQAGAHLNNETLGPFIILNLAGLYRDMHLSERAAQMFEQVVPLLRASHVKIVFPNIMEEIGDFYYSIHDFDRAMAYYDEGLEAAAKIDLEAATRRLYRAKALIAWDRGQVDDVKAYYRLVFQEPMQGLTTEDWHSYILGVFHIAEIIATRQQVETSLLLLRTLAHHTHLRKTRLSSVHSYLRQRCLDTLRHSLTEADLQEALETGETLGEAEMFAHALASLEALT